MFGVNIKGVVEWHETRSSLTKWSEDEFMHLGMENKQKMFGVHLYRCSIKIVFFLHYGPSHKISGLVFLVSFSFMSEPPHYLLTILRSLFSFFPSSTLPI